MALSGHLPDLDSLALLLEVARSGSIGAAARVQGVSQQSASERLTTMERQVGVPLLSRGARGTTLTASGTLMVEWAARMLQVAEEVDASIAALRGARDRELRIVASMTVAEHLLPRWLVALRQQQAHPGTRDGATSVSLRAANSAEVLRAVAAGEADLGFVEGAERPAGLTSTEIGRDELVLVAAASDRLARRRTPLTPAQVAGLALTSRERGSGTREVVEQALATHGLSDRTTGRRGHHLHRGPGDRTSRRRTRFPQPPRGRGRPPRRHARPRQDPRPHRPPPAPRGLGRWRRSARRPCPRPARPGGAHAVIPPQARTARGATVGAPTGRGDGVVR